MERIRDRVAIHLARGRRRIVDPGEIYFIEAVEGGSRMRLTIFILLEQDYRI